MKLLQSQWQYLGTSKLILSLRIENQTLEMKDVREQLYLMKLSGNGKLPSVEQELTNIINLSYSMPSDWFKVDSGNVKMREIYENYLPFSSEKSAYWVKILW